MVLLFVLVMSIIQSAAYCEEDSKFIDVDEDGIKEKVYVKTTSKGSSFEVKTIIVLKNNQNIFPLSVKRCSSMQKLMGTGYIHGGFKIGKFDNYKGLQIFVYDYYYEHSGNTKTTSHFVGYYYKYNASLNSFDYYKKNVTEKMYPLYSKTDLYGEIAKEFEKKTCFMKSFEAVNLFLEHLKNNRYEEAEKMLFIKSDNNLKKIQALCRKNCNLINDLEFDTKDSGVMDGMYGFISNKEINGKRLIVHVFYSDKEKCFKVALF